MAARDGMLSLDDLQRHVTADQIDTVIVAFPDLYGRLVGKRFEANHYLNHVVEEGTHACDYLLTVDMEMNPVPGYQVANWDRGYGDFHLVPDEATLRKTTWLEKTALVICDVADPASHELLAHAPRSVLKRQIDVAARLGFSAMAGSEVEYYIFRDSYRQAHRKGFTGLKPISNYIEDYHLLQATREELLNAAARRHLTHSGIPVECSKGEWGCGQHELNVRYAQILEMADRHAIYKQCLKEIADSLGLSVTFMAKYAADQAGSSCHLHLSLWHNQQNAFAGENELGGVRCSEHFRWFLGGWMQYAHELMVFFAPTFNSYKRFQADSWAPTRLAWSRDNRTAGFRIVGEGPSLRIECRIPGADINPYLAMAAALAAGIQGIAEQIEPPAPLAGNLYRADAVPKLPGSLGEAVELFAQSDLARQAFGETVVDHYAHFFRTEQAAYDQAVTDWERCRYYERI